jgi:cytochrome c-type biogenesis protein
MAGADLDAALGMDPTGKPVAGRGSRRAVRGRILAGASLFVAGFTAVFIPASVLLAQAGRLLLVHQRVEDIVVGALIVVLGFAFMGSVQFLQRDLRVRRLPTAGLIGAPLLGATFGLGWSPCVSPTLGAVLTLGGTGGHAARASALAIAYCFGLGGPFLAFGLGLRRILAVSTWMRRRSRWVTRVGGAMLVLVGLALMTGDWTAFTNWLQATVGSGGTWI